MTSLLNLLRPSILFPHRVFAKHHDQCGRTWGLQCASKHSRLAKIWSHPDHGRRELPPAWRKKSRRQRINSNIFSFEAEDFFLPCGMVPDGAAWRQIGCSLGISKSMICLSALLKVVNFRIIFRLCSASVQRGQICVRCQGGPGSVHTCPTSV